MKVVGESGERKEFGGRRVNENEETCWRVLIDSSGGGGGGGETGVAVLYGLSSIGSYREASEIGKD